MNYKNCPNCNAKIGKSLMGKPNELVSEEFYQKLKEFLPDDFIEKAYCVKCVTDFNINLERSNLYSKYNSFLLNRIYVNKRIDKKKVLIKELDIVVEKREQTIKELIELKFFKDVKIYSNTPDNIDLVGYVESFLVVNCGMWSTASDNFNPLLSVIHDQMASSGSNSDKLLSEGFSKAKDFIKYDACLKGANTIVDFKHSFSELAGNGKILIYSQGTAGIDKDRANIDFTEIEENHNSKLESIKNEIKEIEDYFASRTLADLKTLIESEFSVA